jgi:hypothetical protein
MVNKSLVHIVKTALEGRLVEFCACVPSGNDSCCNDSGGNGRKENHNECVQPGTTEENAIYRKKQSNANVSNDLIMLPDIPSYTLRYTLRILTGTERESFVAPYTVRPWGYEARPIILSDNSYWPLWSLIQSQSFTQVQPLCASNRFVFHTGVPT